jgi:hypothetical protein
MKPLQLQIVSDEKPLAKMDLSPILGLRLLAFAKTNKTTPIGMIDLALRFALSSDGNGPDLSAPDEDALVEFAAKMLMAKPRRAGARK